MKIKDTAPRSQVEFDTSASVLSETNSGGENSDVSWTSLLEQK